MKRTRCALLCARSQRA